MRRGPRACAARGQPKSTHSTPLRDWTCSRTFISCRASEGTMRKTMIFSLVLGVLAGGSIALSPEAWAQADARVPGKQTLSYGAAATQRLEYWPGASAHAPLVAFVHGGGWKAGDMTMMDGSAKLTHWHSLGYAVASLDY